MAQIVLTSEIPMGHRLMNHQGKCRFPHGHNYKVEVSLEVPTLDNQDMVVDFSVAKAKIKAVLDLFDHAMVLHVLDPLVDHLKKAPVPVRLILLDRHPTAEILATLWRRMIFEAFQGAYAVHLMVGETRDATAFATNAHVEMTEVLGVQHC